MSRARDNANLGAQAGSGLDASDITTGVLPVGVTGGSGLTALGTVTAGNLSNSAIVYPAGHVVQVKHEARLESLHSTGATVYNATPLTITGTTGNFIIATVNGGKLYQDTTAQDLICVMKVSSSTDGDARYHTTSAYQAAGAFSSHNSNSGAIGQVRYPRTGFLTASETISVYFGLDQSQTGHTYWASNASDDFTGATGVSDYGVPRITIWEIQG